MKVLITGVCGFVGSKVAEVLREHGPAWDIVGFDNLSRRGAAANVAHLESLGVRFIHGDVRSQADTNELPRVDYVIDTAANPSVLAGVDGEASPRQLLETNLGGTINLLEHCRRVGAGFILLSTSRVYSIEALGSIELHEAGSAFVFDRDGSDAGITAEGVNEAFSTREPLSLYGASKRASEVLASEYGHTFGFPVRINRCGVLAGEGQLGHASQGIFAFWIHSWAERRRLRYIGFGGRGLQVRDCLHPFDLARLLMAQMDANDDARPTIANVGGGRASATSLAQLSAWCRDRFGAHEVEADDRPRAFDLPWLVLDASEARRRWGWEPAISAADIFERIARHAELHPDWTSRCAPGPTVKWTMRLAG